MVFRFDLLMMSSGGEQGLSYNIGQMSKCEHVFFRKMKQ